MFDVFLIQLSGQILARVTFGYAINIEFFGESKRHPVIENFNSTTLKENGNSHNDQMCSYSTFFSVNEDHALLSGNLEISYSQSLTMSLNYLCILILFPYCKAKMLYALQRGYNSLSLIST